MHLRPVALGGEEVAPAVQPPLQEVDVGLISSLEDASLDLMDGIVGDHPFGRRLRTVLGTEVGALADVGIGLVPIRDEWGERGR